MSNSCKDDITPSIIVNVIMPYVIDDVMKIKLVIELRHASPDSMPSPCSDLSTNKSLSLTIGYIGEMC